MYSRRQVAGKGSVSSGIGNRSSVRNRNNVIGSRQSNVNRSTERPLHIDKRNILTSKDVS